VFGLRSDNPPNNRVLIYLKFAVMRPAVLRKSLETLQ
jgi:hypothetical protein